MSSMAVVQTPEPVSRGTAMAELAPRRAQLVRPIVSPAAMREYHDALVDFVQGVLEMGRDYGIPGLREGEQPEEGQKPTLYKAGAERTCIFMGCRPHYEIIESEIDHDEIISWTKRKKKWDRSGGRPMFAGWQEEHGTSAGLYRYVVRCVIINRDDGSTVGEGIGICSTLEGKYVDRPRELENTVIKMAQKRALVAAVLNAFGLSDRFTQDLEDVNADEETTVRRGKTGRASVDREVPRWPFDPHAGQPLNAQVDGEYVIDAGTLAKGRTAVERKMAESPANKRVQRNGAMLLEAIDAELDRRRTEEEERTRVEAERQRAAQEQEAGAVSESDTARAEQQLERASDAAADYAGGY